MKKLSRMLVISSVLASSHSFADEDLGEMSLMELLNTDVKVSSLLGSKIMNSPSSIEVITSEEIERSNADNLSDVLQTYVTGFQSLDQYWINPSWAFRGVGTNRNENIMYSINGEMQTTQSRDGIVGDTVLGLMDDFKRIEVIRGAGSVVHGMGALAGVIAVDLKDGRGEKKHQGEIQIGGHEDIEVQAAEVISSKDLNHVLRLSAGFRKHKEPEANYGGLQSGFQDWEHIEPNGHFRGRDFDDMKRITAVYTNSALDSRLWARYFDADWYPNYHANSPNSQGATPSRGYFHKNLSIAGDTSFHLADGIDAKVSYGYTTLNHGITVGVDHLHYNSTTTANKGDIRESLTESRYKLRGDLTFRNLNYHSFAIGTEYRYDDMGKSFLGKHRNHPLENPNNPVNNQPYRPAQYHNIGLFSEYKYDLDISDWQLQSVLGARFDYHSYEHTFAPRQSLMLFSPKRNHSYRLTAQKSFRNNSADNYEPDRNQAKSSTQAKPASSIVYEAGYRFNNENYIVDLVAQRTDTEITDWNFNIDAQSSNKFTTDGIELSTTALFGKSYKVKFSHSYTNLRKHEKAKSSQTHDARKFSNFMPNITRLHAFYDTNKLHLSLLTQYWWGIPGREKTANWKKETYPNDVKHTDWLTAKSLKMHFRGEYDFDRFTVGTELKNLLAPFSKKHRLTHSFDPSSDYNNRHNESIAWETDHFLARVFVKYHF